LLLTVKLLRKDIVTKLLFPFSEELITEMHIHTVLSNFNSVPKRQLVMAVLLYGAEGDRLNCRQHNIQRYLLQHVCTA
jgi:hypothetical protein